MKEPIRLLHIADIHIGVENYGRLDTETGLHTRLQDFVKCLEFAVDTAVERDVDVVLFAGDAYKHANPNPTHEGKFAEQMKRLTDARIPVVMVTGNHDIPASFGKVSALNIFRTLGNKQYFFVAEKPELYRIETKRGVFQAACFPWPTRHVLLTKDEYKNLPDDEILKTIVEKSVSRIKKFTRDADPDLPLVLVAHLALAEASYSGSEQTTMIGSDPVILKSDLIDPAFDYIALGHIHKHQDVNQNGYPPVVYPGSRERIDFGEASENKGFCLVSLKKDESSYEFIQTPARQFIKVEIDVRSQVFPTEAILKKLTSCDFHDAVVRVSYMINEEQKDQIEVRKIHAALTDAFLVAGVTQRTQEIRTQRPRIAEDLSLNDALAQYLDFRPDLAAIKDELLEYAGRLIRELEVFE